MNTTINPALRPFISQDGHITQLPSKGLKKEMALQYLSEKFKWDTIYTEQEVNEIVCQWHTFGDHYFLRRELVDGGFLARTNNGAQYWRCEEKREESHENTNNIEA